MKVFNRVSLAVLMLLTCLSISHVKAQEAAPTDRVPEVEAELRQDITDHISRLIPKQSFTVAVSITPLKREPVTQTQADVLPFYETSNEAELFEEWEDPSTNYYVLLSRVKKIVVTLSVDKAYSLKNESDLRENLFKSVGLISGRDQLDIRMVDLQSFTKETSLSDFNWWYIGGGVFVLMVLGGAIVLSAKVMQPKMTNPQSNASAASPVSSSIAPAMAGVSLSSNLVKGVGESGAISGDITFTDSLKLNSYLKEKINDLVSKKSFPTLSMLKTLEELLEMDQMGFSYLMSQFPEESKKIIYGYGRTQNWIRAFSQPGLASKNVLLCMDRLQQCHPQSESATLEILFISVWRLGSQLKDYLVSISPEESKFVLYNVPKSLALPIARKTFPGDWAFLFSDKKIELNLNEKRIAELTVMATNLKPLFQLELISFYTNQEELIKFLKLCSPDEERDIYQSYRGVPSLHELRPPFFMFFELSEQERLSIFKCYDIRTWALATFNVSRELRLKVDQLMSEKEVFLFKSYLVELDKNKPSQDQITIVRESVANLTSEKYKLSNNQNEEVFETVSTNEKAA